MNENFVDQEEIAAKYEIAKKAAEEWIRGHADQNQDARADLKKMVCEHARDASDFGCLRDKYGIPKPIGAWLALQDDIVKRGHAPSNEKRIMFYLPSEEKNPNYWVKVNENETSKAKTRLPPTVAKELVRSFCVSEEGKRIADWLRIDLRENGPINWTVFGAAHFLPAGVSVGIWLADASMDFVKAVQQGGGRDYCELRSLSPDSRPVRTKPDILPDWLMKEHKSVPMEDRTSMDIVPMASSRPFFVGEVYFKKSPLGFSGTYVVSDVLSATDGHVADIPLPRVLPNTLAEGEFVVGLNSAKGPFLFFNQKVNSAVQILMWESFKESQQEPSAETYFSKNPTGLLTASFESVLGSEERPGHVIIVDKEEKYLKGFSSIGKGLIRYFSVEKFTGDFRRVSSANQVTEMRYKGNAFAILVPEQVNEYAEANKHAVIDCEGWSALPPPPPPPPPPPIEEILKVCEVVLQDGAWHDRVDLLKELNERIPGMSASGVSDSAIHDGLRGFSNVELRDEEVGNWSVRIRPDDGGVAWNEDERLFFDGLKTFSKSCGYSYTDADLVRFHTSFKCSRMVILGGAPGVGKSSLARLYAAYIGGRDDFPYLAVAVNPAWVEPADLLGSKDFTSEFKNSACGLAKFMRAAEGDKDNIYPVCFEEMNLACAEHYFSDFMQAVSVPMKDTNECVVIEGYDEAGFEIKNRDPLKVTSNLRIVGTCNFDVTTHPFSPRFYDRCAYIELGAVIEDFPERLPALELGKLPGRNADVGNVLALHLNEWLNDGGTIDKDVTDEFKRLLIYLEKVDLQPSPRIAFQMKRYILSRPPFDEAFRNEKELQHVALDEALAQYDLAKYMPATNEELREKQAQLKEFLSKNNFSCSIRLLETIEKRFSGFAVS